MLETVIKTFIFLRCKKQTLPVLPKLVQRTRGLYLRTASPIQMPPTSLQPSEFRQPRNKCNGLVLHRYKLVGSSISNGCF